MYYHSAPNSFFVYFCMDDYMMFYAEELKRLLVPEQFRFGMNVWFLRESKCGRLSTAHNWLFFCIEDWKIFGHMILEMDKMCIVATTSDVIRESQTYVGNMSQAIFFNEPGHSMPFQQ